MKLTGGILLKTTLSSLVICFTVPSAAAGISRCRYVVSEKLLAKRAQVIVADTSKTAISFPIFSQRDASTLNKLSTAEANGSEFRIENLGQLRHEGRESGRGQKWTTQAPIKVNTYNLELLVQTDPRFDDHVRSLAHKVLTSLPASNSRQSIDVLAHSSGLFETPWQRDAKEVESRLHFWRSKSILGMLSKAVELMNFSKPEVKADLDSLFELVDRYMNDVEHGDQYKAEDAYRYLVAVSDSFFMDLKTQSDAKIQFHTDMKLLSKATFGYLKPGSEPTSLGEYIKSLLARRQSAGWLNLAGVQELSVENMVINVGWKNRAASTLFASYKGDFDGQMIVEFTRSSDIQSQTFQNLAKRVYDIFRTPETSDMISDVTTVWGQTMRERASKLTIFDLPLAVSGKIRFKNVKLKSGKTQRLPVLVVERVVVNARDMSFGKALQEYDEFVRDREAEQAAYEIRQRAMSEQIDANRRAMMNARRENERAQAVQNERWSNRSNQGNQNDSYEFVGQMAGIRRANEFNRAKTSKEVQDEYFAPILRLRASTEQYSGINSGTPKAQVDAKIAELKASLQQKADELSEDGSAQRISGFKVTRVWREIEGMGEHDLVTVEATYKRTPPERYDGP